MSVSALIDRDALAGVPLWSSYPTLYDGVANIEIAICFIGVLISEEKRCINHFRLSPVLAFLFFVS